MAGVLGFLVISFGIWGIGDIFRGFGRSWLAKVGGTEIGAEQFRQTYNERLQELGRRLGRPITPEQAQALGLPRQMLSQMLADAALDERVRQLGLNLSDSEIARQITLDPNFKGATGQFDRFRARPKDKQKLHPAPKLTESVSETGHVDDDAPHQLLARNFPKPGMRHQ